MFGPRTSCTACFRILERKTRIWQNQFSEFRKTILGRKPATDDPYAAAHAGRLRHIAERHSLSEIARRTGFPVSCIHGYLNGTRIPADLFSRLVDEFSVNPQWLHTGKGAPYSSDVSPDTASMAEDVLQLVTSMEAVSKVKLGALSGRQPLVRKLDEALNQHEHLRKRLSDQTGAIIRKLLDDADRALDVRKFDVVQANLATASRLRKLCADPILSARLMNTEAMFARFQGQGRRALEGYREAFLNVLPARQAFGTDGHVVAFNYANSLFMAGELREAIAVTEGMLVLGDQAESTDRAMLMSHRGWLDILNGDLHQGISRMTHVMPLIPQSRRTRVETPRYMAAQLYAGLTTFGAALAGVEDSVNKGVLLTNLAILMEDLGLLGELFDRYFGGDEGFIEDAKGRVGATTSLGRYMNALVGVIRDDDLTAVAKFDKVLQESATEPASEFFRFPDLVHACQLARLAGKRPQAKRRLEAAERCLQQIPASVTPDFLELACHYRNAIELGGRGALPKRAKQYFRDMVGKGYECFRAFAGS